MFRLDSDAGQSRVDIRCSIDSEAIGSIAQHQHIMKHRRGFLACIIVVID